MLVEQLVVSSHEFFFIVFLLLFLTLFHKQFPKSFYHCFHHFFLIHLCFIFFTTSSSSFRFQTHFLNHFTFHFTFLAFILPTPQPLLFCFHITILSPSSPIISRFLFFSISHFFNKEELLTTDVNKNC